MSESKGKLLPEGYVETVHILEIDGDNLCWGDCSHLPRHFSPASWATGGSYRVDSLQGNVTWGEMPFDRVITEHCSTCFRYYVVQCERWRISAFEYSQTSSSLNTPSLAKVYELSALHLIVH